jgi:lysophospholipase L1-like esterase
MLGHMIPPGSRYVAMGSSYAAGPGILPVEHWGALRSGRNYPHQVAQALSLRLTDVTCSGATTSNILTTPQRTLSGTLPPQIDAVTPDTRLVTVTAGGNDAGYIGALTKISVVNAVLRRVPSIPPQAAGRLHRWAGAVPAPSQFDAVSGALTRVVEAVRGRAPQAQMVLVDYLSVLAPGATGPGHLPLADDEARQFSDAAASLAAAFEQAATATGAGLVRASAASAGHGAGSADPWVTGLRFGIPFTGGPVPYHPTLAGMSAVARLVIDHLYGADS